MSKPIDKTHDITSQISMALFLLKFGLVELGRKKLKKFKSGGIVACEVHQGEAIINRKSGFYCPPPNFAAQPKCKNVLNKSQSDALDILKNINQFKK